MAILTSAWKESISYIGPGRPICPPCGIPVTGSYSWQPPIDHSSRFLHLAESILNAYSSVSRDRLLGVTYCLSQSAMAARLKHRGEDSEIWVAVFRSKTNWVSSVQAVVGGRRSSPGPGNRHCGSGDGAGCANKNMPVPPNVASLQRLGSLPNRGRLRKQRGGRDSMAADRV
jgi:hypothetical protein